MGVTVGTVVVSTIVLSEELGLGLGIMEDVERDDIDAALDVDVDASREVELELSELLCHH